MNIEDCFREGLLKKIESSMEKATRSIDMAEEYIKMAKDNLDIENYPLVIFCSYTAMFHSARGILYKDGVKERSHACIGIYIREKYPAYRELANIFDSYRKSRHTTLYSLGYLITEEDAEKAIRDAEYFLEIVKGIIKC